MRSMFSWELSISTQGGREKPNVDPPVSTWMNSLAINRRPRMSSERMCLRAKFLKFTEIYSLSLYFHRVHAIWVKQFHNLHSPQHHHHVQFSIPQNHPNQLNAQFSMTKAPRPRPQHPFSLSHNVPSATNLPLHPHKSTHTTRCLRYPKHQ